MADIPKRFTLWGHHHWLWKLATSPCPNANRFHGLHKKKNCQPFIPSHCPNHFPNNFRTKSSSLSTFGRGAVPPEASSHRDEVQLRGDDATTNGSGHLPGVRDRWISSTSSESALEEPLSNIEPELVEDYYDITIICLDEAKTWPILDTLPFSGG